MEKRRSEAIHLDGDGKTFSREGQVILIVIVSVDCRSSESTARCRDEEEDI